MARRARKPTGDYEVGYCKPPIETRFPNQTGTNRKGRPKGSPNIATILDRILNRKVTVRIGDTPQPMTYFEYLFVRASETAGKGDLSAFKFIIEMRQRFPTLAPGADAAQELTPDDRAIIADFIARLPDEGEDEP